MKQDRRKFIKLGASTIAGAIFIAVIPKRLGAQEETQEPPVDEDWMDRYYAYVVDTTKCIGCGNCVRADKRENGVLEEYFRTWVERYLVTEDDHVHIDSPNGGHDGFPPLEIKGRVTKGFFVPKICHHCRKAPCIQVCPVNASYMSPDGVVLVDKELCIGCGYCVQACPYGTRYIDPRTHTADKCTWCYHRITKGLMPACVVSCPVGARRFGDLKAEHSEIKEIIETERVNVMKQHLGTEPFCFYIGLEKTVR